MPEISIYIQRVRVNLDPPHDVFSIELANDNGEWRFTAVSEDSLKTFLEGVRAGMALCGGSFKEEPEIPPFNPVSTLQAEVKEAGIT